ncbi:hypothetical protein QIS99_06275 [Streptomyces sp. B-S-A8]|uniref:Glycosyltransferase RgtA/B/C/D-like domain-containing protein n=1 Tax=Streptomyces solicavernae TaxID=3043614 RepID=A0ABT6RNJ7_9ACTN|nr:hypothetical protein [Streptomyces sp. B-S-A8]MDI3385824.1 hypothetical protein [Streptomyces sp. B-S-A8]
MPPPRISVPTARQPAQTAQPAQRAHRALLAVCAAFVVLPALLVPLSLPLGWDEIVYAGRFASYAQGLDVPFEAPRTRGVPVLMAPVALWSDDVVLLRAWLGLLAGVALYAGYVPWLRVLRARPSVVPLAAAGYASLWFTLFYAGSAMPNHYTAMGATAGVGWFLRHPGTWARRGEPLRASAGLACGLGLATLTRPNDAAWIAAPLVLAALAHRPWRRAAPLAALTAGVLAGGVPWLVESELRFGGVRERLALATDQQGGVRLQFNLPAVLNALDGPLLCRPCAPAAPNLPTALWWYALPVLVAAGVWLVLRGPDRGAPDRAAPNPGDPDRGGPDRGGPDALPVAAVVLPVLVAGSASVTYLFLLDYSAARFLLTPYALLALPAALAVRALWGAARRHGRVAVGLLGLVLAGQLAVQLAVAHGHADIQAEARADWHRITAVLREAGVGRGCVLDGNSMVIPVAYTAGCFPAAQRPGRPPDAWVLRRAEPPSTPGELRVIPVPGTYNAGWRVAIPR